MTPVEITARDGATLVSYLTLPGGSDANGDARPEQALPLVLLAHDGPWSRNSYGFDATHQWLANRGYAVLSVNFRGSAGFGKAFLNAGNLEWGGRIQEDLADAAAWAVTQGIAEEGRVAIVGSGFRGYSVLTGLAFTPDSYRCGASFAAPSNLFAMLDLSPSASERDQLYRRVADARTRPGANCCACARRRSMQDAFAARCCWRTERAIPGLSARRNQSCAQAVRACAEC